MKYFFVFLILFFSNVVLAQPKGAEVVERNGVECYIHTIEPGNTLYGLHRLYNVSVEDILKNNPRIKDNFKEGNEVFIPLSIIEKKESLTELKPKLNKDLPIFHEVESKETLYGISRKYGTTIDYIKENNEVLNEGLKPGQKLLVGYEKDTKSKPTQSVEEVTKIGIEREKVQKELTIKIKNEPIKKTIDSSGFNPDAIVKHKVLEGETLYSISKRYMIPLKELYNYNDFRRTGIAKGDLINVPVVDENGKKVEVRQVSEVSLIEIDSNYLHERKDNYNIAILLPFFLDELNNDTVPNRDFIKMVSNLSTDFLMGLELSLDTLEILGVSASFNVYDTKNDSNQVAHILDSLLKHNVDLIIGPFFSDRITEVASWCYEYKIKMICPVSTNISVLKGNPYVDVAISSDYTLMEGLAKYTLNRNNKEKVILIKPKNESDKLLYDHFRESYLSNIVNENQNLIEASLSDYKLHIPNSGKSILVFPSTDEGVSLKFISDLMSYTDNRGSNITIFGTKEWLNYENMKGSYLNKFNVHMASPNNFSFKDSLVNELAFKYREKYSTDLTKISALGFDVSSYVIHRYLLHDINVFEGVMGNMDMLQKGEGNGFENNSVLIIHQQDYELLKVQNDQ